MKSNKPLFSVCIPAYNRARHLRPLLDSILKQNFDSFEILICEDVSRERKEIAGIIQEYQNLYPNKIRYHENPTNLGYDANIRNLVALANGRYCFFMGNDDIMCQGSLSHVSEIIDRHPKIGMVLKSYAWFDETPEKINQEVRYFSEEKFMATGAEAISICFRRAGVISGYIIDRDLANSAATNEFDGTLYYQMHLTGSVLAEANAVATPKVLVLCRNSEPPEFGNSGSEKGKYTPGAYTPQARLNMIGGALSIARSITEKKHIDITKVIIDDYANYFYPYIKDQLNLPIKKYLDLYCKFGRMGFKSRPMFHFYMIFCYITGEKNFDLLTKKIRGLLGRSPQFGLRK